MTKAQRVWLEKIWGKIIPSSEVPGDTKKALLGLGMIKEEKLTNGKEIITVIRLTTLGYIERNKQSNQEKKTEQAEPLWTLNAQEKRFLESKGYILSKNVFQDDICSREPNKTGEYNCAVSMLAMILGYRDRYDFEFQRARKAFRQLYED